MGTPHDSAHAIPNNQCTDNVGPLYVSNDNKRAVPLLLTNGAAAKSEHFYAPNGAQQDSAHAIPSDQCIDNVEALYTCNDIKRTLPLLLTNGATAKYEHFNASNGARQFLQSFAKGSPRSFSPHSFVFSQSSLGDNRIKEEPVVKSNGFQRCATNGNGTSSSTMSAGSSLRQYHPWLLSRTLKLIMT
uniref:Uncharacterized protein n=1 Tax=Arundo donax TaxID=35708 RepID=A0A0A9BWS8_ARUDO